MRAGRGREQEPGQGGRGEQARGSHLTLKEALAKPPEASSAPTGVEPFDAFDGTVTDTVKLPSAAAVADPSADVPLQGGAEQPHRTVTSVPAWKPAPVTVTFVFRFPLDGESPIDGGPGPPPPPAAGASTNSVSDRAG